MTGPRQDVGKGGRGGWSGLATGILTLGGLGLIALPGPAQANICDRTDQVKAAILNEISGITACEDVTAVHLNQITGRLDLGYDDDLSVLQENDFAGLSNLQTLYLDRGSLSSLDGNIFAGLSNLQRLYLDSNDLSSLDGNIFAGLSNLQRLYLDSNDLSSLDGNIFAGLSSLQVLSLKNNELRSMNVNAFAGLSNLQRLNLDGNDLLCLPRSLNLPWDRVADGDLSLDLPDCFGVSLSVTPTEVKEGNGESITVTAVLRDGARGKPEDTEVIISMGEDTAGQYPAREGVDFTAVEDFTITIPNRSTSATGAFTLTARIDAQEEPGGETVLVSGTSILSASAVPGTEVRSATVTIKDNPVGVHSTRVSLAEDGTTTYTVMLKSLPPGAVTITPTSDDSGAVSLSPASLVFTTSNWDTAQNVTVTGVQDYDPWNETLTISHGVSGYGAVSMGAIVTIIVTDDDAPETSVCERTPAVRTAILNNLVGRPDCRDVFTSNLNEMTGELYLKSAGLSTLKKNDFADLSSLVALRLDSNSLSSLDQDIFADLASLEELFLLGNALESLPEGIFDGLSGLRQLYVRDNRLVCLPRSLPWDKVADGDLTLDVNLPDCFGVSLSVSPAEVREDNGGEGVTVTATLSEGERLASVDTEVTISVVEGTATQGRDFTAVGDFTITIPDGSESATGTFTLTAAADTEAEAGGETVLVSGTSIFSASSIPGTEVGAATVTIRNAISAFLCDRTPAVQTAILQEIPGITDCADATINQLNRITGVLVLSGGNGSEKLSSLKANDFAHLSSLQYLYLDSNALGSLPANIFSDLTSVQWLLLNDNSLSSLDMNIFAGLASLQELYLNNNALSRLPEGIFDGLSQLTDLGLSGNGLPCLQRGDVWSRVMDGDLRLDVPDCFGVNLSVTPMEVLEDNLGSRVTVSATLNDGERATPVDTQVSISVAGDTAIEGVDFTTVNDFTITIPSGSANATEAFILRATEDTEAEPGGETMQVRGTSIFSSSAIPGTAVRDATVTIKDNVLAPICDRTPAVQTAILQGIPGITACEDVTLIRLNRLSGSLTLSSQGLSSLQRSDFAHLSSLQWLLLNDNDLSTLPEGVFSDLSSLQSLNLVGNNLECLPRSVPWDRVAAGDLTLDVDLPDCFGVSLNVTPIEVREGSGGESITVSATLQDGPRAKPVDTQVSISVGEDSTSQNTAGEGTDFAAVAPFTITIPSGRESATATFILAATADNEVEPGGETVLVSGASNVGAYVAQVDSAMVTIKDATPGVSVSPTSLMVVEGNSGVYTLVLDALPTGAVTITPISENSGALVVSPARLIFTTANWNTAQTVRVIAGEDDDINNGTITVSHGVSGYGGISFGDVLTVSITDDDATPTVSVCDRTPIVQTVILEAIDGITTCEDVTVGHLNRIRALFLGFNPDDLGSLQEGDFAGLFSLQQLFLYHNALGSLPTNIFAGLSSLNELHLNNNSLSSLDTEIFGDLSSLQILDLTSNQLSSLPEDLFNGLDNLQVLLLGDNDLTCLPRRMTLWERVANDDLTIDLPDCFGVSLSVTPTEVDEGNGGESITVRATLNDGPRSKPGEATQVSISVVGDTATEGADFTAVETFTITIPDRSENATGTFTLNARRDTVEDDGETVLVSGTSMSSAYSAEVGSATVTIRNMVPPDFSLSLTANQRQVNEGEAVYFTLTRAQFDPLSTDPLPAATVWVQITHHNKILAPEVERPFTLRRVAFEEGQESFELLAVVTHDDELNDGDGMVRADLDLEASGSSYDVLQGQAWTRVVDDDIPEVTLILLKDRIVEGDRGIQWEIRRNCCPEERLSIGYDLEEVHFQPNDYFPNYLSTYSLRYVNPHSFSIVRLPEDSLVYPIRYHPINLAPEDLNLRVAGGVGPLGGYKKYRLHPFPDIDNFQGIPEWDHETFLPRYTVPDTSWKQLNVDNATPGVSIETSQTAIQEGDEVEFTIKRFGGLPGLMSIIGQNIRINVEQTGDYLPANQLGTRVARMEIGQTEYKLRIPTNDDPFNYPDGSVTVTILEGAPTGLSEDTYGFATGYSEAAGGYLYKASVDITDDDGELSEIALSPTELQIPEGGSGTYTVMLTTPPEYGETNVKPLKFPDGDPDVAVASSTLTFSADDWNIPQTVTITAEDDDDMNDDSAEIVHTMEFLPTSGSPFRANVVVFSPSVQVSVLDNDLPRVSLSISDDFIGEAGGVATVTATLSESLTTSTSLNVLVTPVAPAGSTDYQLSSNSTLTFSAGETTAEGTVTITAVNNDVDAPDKVLRVRGEITGETNILVNNELELVIQDDDSRGLTASTNTLSIHEGHAGTYTVVLDTQPTGDVTVTPSRSSGDTDMTISDALTFSASNWNTPQTVTIAAPEDGDDEDGIASIIHRTSGGDYDSLGQLGIVIVNITDNDTPGVTLSKTTLAIDEGSSETYTVVLNTQPTGDVIVTPSRSSGDEDVTVPRALIFSSGNWNLPQTVTVHAADDDDPNDDTATIAHTVSGANYGAVTADSVQVSVTDSDPRGVTLSETTLNIDEGSTATYTVVLNTLPSGDVTITPSRSDGSDTDVTVSDALIFSTANWNIPQTVSVRAAEDNDPNDDAATIVHAVSGADYAVVIAASVDVIVTDNDTRGITLSDPTLNMNEGSTGTYTVVLNTQPTGDVTVTPSRNDDSDTDVTVSNILTFSIGNWNTPQTVTVHAAEDNDPNNDTATILHAVSGADYDTITAAPAVAVTVTDNDTRGITVSETALTFNEGGTATYTVMLDTQPSGDVTVAPSRSDGSDTDVTVSNALTFSTGNWNIPQTVTVNAAEDNDASNDMATITHTVSGADYDSVTAAPAVTVTVTDNDTRGITVSETTLTFNEGGTATYTMVLDTQPSGDVTVTPSRSDGSDTDVTVSNTLTFSTGNWNIPQTVTVNAAEDNDASNDMATITHTVSGADYDSVTAAPAVTVTVTDNDTRGITVSETTLTFNEGGTATYTMVLDTQPSGDVTVTPSRSDGSDTDVTVSNALTFSTGNWNTPQTVTINAAEDDDASNDMATINHTVSGADYGSVTATSVQLTITDNDTRGITIPEPTLSFNEGGTVTYTVVLGTQPNGDVTVTPSRTDDSDTDVTVSNALTFSTGNWNIPQTVTVNAAEDNDASNDTATIAHTVSGADYGSVTAASVDVIVTDNDTRGVSISKNTLSVGEGGTVTYTVALATEPSGNVTITPSSGDSGAVSVSPASLTFTPSDWNTTQIVSVTGVPDGNVMDESVTISHAVAGADYGANSVTVDGVDVTVRDDDRPEVNIEYPGEYIYENETAVFTLTRTTEALNENLTVTLSVSEGDNIAATFPVGEHSISVNIPPLQDREVDNDRDLIVTINDGEGHELGSANSATVTVRDDDGLIIEIDFTEPYSLSGYEGDTVTPQLVMRTLKPGLTSEDVGRVFRRLFPSIHPPGTPPATSINVDVLSWPSSAISPDDYYGIVSETFTLSLADLSPVGDRLEMTIPLTPGVDLKQDNLDEPVEQFFFVLQAPAFSLAAYHGRYRIPDRRSPGGVTCPLGTGTLNCILVEIKDLPVLAVADLEGSEASGALEFSVTLNEEFPRDEVTVTYETSDETAVAGEDYASMTGTLRIPAGQTQGLIRIPLLDDDIVEESETFFLTLSSPASATLAQSQASGVILDDDTRGLLVTPTALTMREDGEDRYTVVLTSQPTQNVTITPANGDSGALSLSPSRLTFTAVTWNTPQTVGVRGVEDHDAANETVTISHSISGYDAPSLGAVVTVTVTDNDNRGVTISETALTFNEGGTATYTVVLHTQPTDDVTVTPSRTDGSDTDVTISNALTFSSGNWNTPQTVTVNAAEDNDASNDMATITHTVSGADYDSVAAASVQVTVTDNDNRGVTISETALTFNEGGTATYTVVLHTQPTDDVTVTPSRTDGSDTDVTISNALTFSSGNWNTPQTMTVNAAEDNDASNDMATITHTVSGADYGSVTAASVVVTVTDGDTRGVTISETALTFNEGGTATYTVVLHTQPTDDVTVTPSRTDGSDTDVTVSNALVFSTDNWNTPQTVTLNAAEDNDASNDDATIDNIVSGADYGSVTATSVVVTVTDSDTRGVTISETALTFNEGGTATYTVVLHTQPTDDVTVTPSRTDDSDMDVTVSNALTFSTGNWNTPQTVTISAAEDNDASNDMATITHTVSGADYGSVTATSVVVTVTDSDTRGVTISETALTFNEGGTATYTVVLHTQPTDDVTVTPSRTDDSDMDVTVSNALTFSTGNWNTPQTVTVNAAEDSDTSNDTATINHSISGADYASVTAASVQVTVTDNDTGDSTLSESNRNNNVRGVTISDFSVSVNEGTTQTYTVVLNTQPTGDVTVTPSRSSSNRDVTVSDTLTFSTSNWDTPQIVIVSAAEDDDASNDDATIDNIVSGADYDSVTAASVDVIVIDDDIPGITISETALTFNEGGTATYTVVLHTQPTDDVTVTPSRTDGSDTDVTISNALTFSTGNWNTPQTVTINAAEDNDASNDAATITHTVSGADYDSVAAASVQVTVMDNDNRGVTISETALTFNEGGTATYTVVLHTQPTDDVTVTPSRTDDSDTDVTISNALTFSTGNWNTPQTVTINAAEDDDASNDAATITHTVSGADYGSVTAASVQVTVTDNDARGITVSETALTFNEGGTATYTVVLHTQPTDDVTVTPSRTDDSDTDVTISNALTFSTGNWNTPQTVTLNAAEDDDASNDTATITHTVSGADYDSVAAASVQVTVTDNDNRGVTISETALTFNEEGTATYTVVLNTQPTDDVTVTPSRTDGSDTDVTLSNALIFSTGNWNTPQTVTINAAEDDDASNDAATITHTVSGADYDSVAAALVQVTVTDNDNRGVTVSETALTFNEGGTATYTVVLHTQPTDDVIVTPSRTDGSDTDVTISNALTFSTGNWNTPQTVTVNAAEDDDASNDTATITYTVSGADYGSVTAASVQVTVTDNDNRGVTISETALTFNEGGTATYTVVLHTQPTDDVTVTPSRTDGSDTDVTVSNSLTFSTGNWNTPQTVTINAAEDDDASNDMATITHTVSGSDYGSVTAASVQVTVTDNDNRGVTISETALTFNEGGTATYTVVLHTQPTDDVTVTPSRTDGSDTDVTISNALTFSTGNWNTPQTVTINAAEDDDASNDMATITHTVSGADYDSVAAASVQVTVTDNDNRGVTISETALTFNEGGTATYTVVLHTQPTDDVTVTPSRTDGSDTDVTLSNALIFSTGNWNTPQTVTINAAEDDDASNDAATITHTVSGADYDSVAAASVQVTVTDNDNRGVTVSETALTFNEGGTATYTVVLHTQPTDDVIVTPSRTDGSDTDVTISNALTFSTGNWNTPQTVTINAAEDDDASNDAATITHTVSGADYDSVAAASVQVTVTDNDNRGVTVSETALTFNEGGTATYTVVLHTQPTDDVTVTPSRTDDSDTDVTISNALTFSTGNWNTPQTVTIIAAEDNDASNDAATITHTVSGADYGSVTAASVQVTVTDNDNRGVTISETALTFNEGGTATYTVVLHTQPTDDVTVTPSRTDGSDTDVTISNALTFSTGNWNTPQTVTINAAEDNDASNDAATITHTVSGADYDSVAAASVQVTVTDNDNRGVTISETALTFNEGGTATYTVVLHTQPTDDVTVTPSRSDDSDTDVTVSNALTFSTGNWNTPQTVTINAAEDNDASNDTATITHTVSGADYDSVAAASVQVTVTDNDARGVTISETALTFNEGGTATYTVVLHTQPTDDVTVTPSRTDGSDTDVTISNALTFSTGNWNTPQTVTINAAEDNDASNDAATITHTVSGADYDSVAAASVQVTVMDNDNRGVTISETALTFNEGGTATYTVVLHTQPTDDVTVTPSRTDDSDTDVTISNALTFSTGNWNTPQTVTINAAEDDDASNDAATITHTVSGADYGSVTAASVQVTVTDNDARGITVSETALTFNEGGTATYTVVLHTQPTDDVTVTPSRTDGSDTDVTISNALTFSTGNWNTPQTVTVNAAEDNDASNDAATITHTVSGADYDSVAAASVQVTVTDNDARGVTISETALTFNEGGTATYTVVLHTQPTDDVTVTPSRTDGSDTDVTISNALTFSTGNWNTPQTVTINAAEDNDASNDAATITHTVSGADYDSVAAASVQVTVTDNDARGITVSETALTFNEGGTATYTVVFHTQPTDDVTVTPSRTGDSDTDVIISNALIFSTSNWNTPQTVTINAAEDNDASNDAATITHTVSGADYGSITAASVDVAVIDNDTRGVTLSETTVSLNEGSTVTCTVVLNTRPTGDVMVTPSKTDDSDTDVIISNALIFSTSNWDTPQTMTVRAAEDSDGSNDTATITHAVSGADYDTVTAASVDVIVIDDDTPGITISEPTLTFNEGGTATYTVVLNTQPSGDVTVTPSRTDGSDTDVTVSNALTFSTGNWNTPQTVTVRAAEDDDPDNDTATITHDVSGADYDTITSTPAVTITVTDNDTRGVTISKKILNFDEGSTEIYTVVLNACSTGDVMVTPSKSSGDMDVTVSDTLTFSPSNWDTPQTVTVSAVEDSDASNDTATIAHAVSGADYGSIPAASVQVMVNDNGTVSTVLTLEASPEIVQEEDRTRMVTLTGTLNKAPWTTHMHVLVTVGAAGDGAIEGVDYSQVADLTLTIPAGETVGTTTFTLTLLDDSIDEYDETILVAGSSLQMEVIPTTITIRNNDPMPQGWLSRFGRTVADQVLDAVAGRLQASRYTGIDVQLAGQQLGSSLTENDLQRLWSEKIREEDLLTNSSFTLTTGSEDTGFAGLWGQGAISHFRGREENLSLDGDVLSGMVGMDWTHGPTAAGLLLSHASGQGTFYSDVDAGTAAATLTGLYPYAHHAFNEQMALWGVLGYGQGDYTLTQQHLPPIASNISLVMAALSSRNILVQPSVEDDFTIALKADLLAVQLSSEAVSGMFKGAEALVTRFRLGLEGSRQLQLDNGNLLTPSFEVGVRRDGGDAEIGFGADIGMGLAWSNPALGIASELRGRALLSHAAAGFHEQGLALDFSYDPTPSSQHGLSFSMGQSMGAAASGGMDALLSPTTLAALDSPADVGQQQLEARLAYGFPILGDALYMTPSLGFTRSPQDRTYGLGLMFSPSDNHPQASDLEISLEGERREPTNADATPEHSLQLRFSLFLEGTARNQGG